MITTHLGGETGAGEQFPHRLRQVEAQRRA